MLTHANPFAPSAPFHPRQRPEPEPKLVLYVPGRKSPSFKPTLFATDPYTVVDDQAATVREGFLMAYRNNTLAGYRTDLKLWFRWCADHSVPILEAKRVHIETYMLEMELVGLANSTRQRRLTTIGGFYRYAEQEDIIRKSPATFVRRPRVSQESSSNYLDRYELGRFLNAAEATSIRHAALSCLLALNGLRVSEACEARIEGLAFANGHRTLSVIRKGGKQAEVPLAPRTFRTIVQACGDRQEGPIVLDSYGNQMSRHAAARAVRLIARRAGIGKSLGPHALRHTFVSLGLDAGVSLRDMQVAAGHAHVSTTVRYDRRARNLDRHAVYHVAAFITGG